MSIDRVDAAGLTDADLAGIRLWLAREIAMTVDAALENDVFHRDDLIAHLTDDAMRPVVRLRTARDEAEAKVARAHEWRDVKPKDHKAINHPLACIVCGVPKDSGTWRTLCAGAALAVTSPPSEGSEP